MKNFLLTVALSTCAIQPAAANTEAGFCAAAADTIVSIYEGRHLGITASKTMWELHERLPPDRMEYAQVLVDIAYIFPITTPPHLVWDMSYAACMSESM